MRGRMALASGHDGGGGGGGGPRRPGLLAGMRIRKKMIVLHTVFSLVLAGALALALRRAVNEVVSQAELHEAKLVARIAAIGGNVEGLAPAITIWSGSAEALGLDDAQVAGVGAGEGDGLVVQRPGEPARVVVRVAGRGGGGGSGGADEFVAVSARLEEARTAALKLHIVLLLTLLAIYGLVAAALETLVLPQHVYGPIERIIDADRAVREGDRAHELIPENAMPADELGGIMRSRNLSISSLREHERALAGALGELERVAGDLSKKNHLLETARRNLADADRLASLGMMSAGIAHELNTPLAVIKGLVEKLNAGMAGAAARGGAGVTGDEAALMLRVVRRLERLSESLLDFARARPSSVRPADLAVLTDEAMTLVRLDRSNVRGGGAAAPGSRPVELVSRVPAGTMVECDPDRITQVLVNLMRNAAESAASARAQGLGPGCVEVETEWSVREGGRWVMLSIRDNGPGIDPGVLSRLFEPFATTKLDSRGTGLGLAVSQGIVHEHGGLLTARNREASGAVGNGAGAGGASNGDPGSGSGAIFEVMLPERAMESGRAEAEGAGTPSAAPARSSE